MPLRAYQTAALDAILEARSRGHRKCLVYMATGSGKTRVLTAVYARLANDVTRCVIVASSIALVYQLASSFSSHARSVRRYDESGCDDAAILVTTYHSMPEPRESDMFLFDEAHHATSESWVNKCVNGRYAFAVFVTATPVSRPGFRMLPSECMGDGVCGPLVFSYSIPDGIDDHVLDPFRIVTPIRRKCVVESIGSAMRAFGHKRCMCFCGRATADHGLLDNVRSLMVDAGWEAQGIEVAGVVGNSGFSRTGSDLDAKAFIDDVSSADLRVLVACTAMGEGIDTCACDMVCFVNPKHSPALIVQNVGRALRPKGRTATVLLNTAAYDLKAWGTVLTVLASLRDACMQEEVMLWRDTQASRPRGTSSCTRARRVAVPSDVDARRRTLKRHLEANLTASEVADHMRSLGMSGTIEDESGRLILTVPGSKDCTCVAKTDGGRFVIANRNRARRGLKALDIAMHSDGEFEVMDVRMNGAGSAGGRLSRMLGRWCMAPPSDGRWFAFASRMQWMLRRDYLPPALSSLVVARLQREDVGEFRGVLEQAGEHAHDGVHGLLHDVGVGHEVLHERVGDVVDIGDGLLGHEGGDA
jgi:superfamily II DNA or RNA helicase